MSKIPPKARKIFKEIFDGFDFEYLTPGREIRFKQMVLSILSREFTDHHEIEKEPA